MIKISPTRVTVWNEYCDEKTLDAVKAHYPNGLHTVIADGLARVLGERVKVRTSVLDDDEHGLTEDVLDDTDVLTWWGHRAHEDVSDVVVERVKRRVLAGMGLIVLHSAGESKIFRSLVGTSGTLRWRVAQDRHLLWTVNPGHEIAKHLPHPIVVPVDEMYGEYFDIPVPDELVFISSFSGGEVFRSGCCFVRGNGRIFYFSPGHETFPVYHQTEIQQALANAVIWASGDEDGPIVARENVESQSGWFERAAPNLS